MTDQDVLKDLKRVAKDVARGNAKGLHEVQKAIAEVLGFAHWHALANQAKLGWRPTEDDLIKAAEIYRGDVVFPDIGTIGIHPYRLDVVLHDVTMSGRGWCIFIGEAPSFRPQVMITDWRFKRNPITDPAFVAEALPIAEWKARQVRAEISRDWPRNSTMPDAKGSAMHPLFRGRSDTWYCFHCDGKFLGAEMAANVWHCLTCGATPLDISTEPFSGEVGQAET